MGKCKITLKDSLSVLGRAIVRSDQWGRTRTTIGNNDNADDDEDKYRSSNRGNNEDNDDDDNEESSG